VFEDSCHARLVGKTVWSKLSLAFAVWAIQYHTNV